MRSIPDASVDCVISDIPYGISLSDWDVLHQNTNSALLGASPAQAGKPLFEKRGKPLNGWSAADKNIGQEYQDWCSEWLAECLRVTKEASPILIMCGRQYQHRFTVAAENSGFVFKDYLVWDKVTAPFRAQNVGKVLEKRGLASSDNWRLGNLAPMHEPIVYMFKPYKVGSTITDRFVEDGVGCFDADISTSNIIRVNSKISGRVHEAQKPLELMETLVKLVSKEGATVLDLFMGSGTTGVACVNTGRRFIGMEKMPEYFDVASKRIADAELVNFAAVLPVQD
jgi:site-specific DNA-methyltransferase (adenine-specific)